MESSGTMTLPYSHPSHGPAFTSPNWNLDADLSEDDIVDALDLYLLGGNYGKTA